MKLILQYPVKDPTITQHFGENAVPLYKQLGMLGHNGYDFYAPDGTPVMACHAGTVTYAGLDGSNGNLIVIKTDEPFDYLNGQAYYKTLYGHLKTGTYKVTAGDKVVAGQIIAQADNTGASSGSHLHLGIKAVERGEQDWVWYNIEAGNGYNGALDPAPFFETQLVYFNTTLKKGDSGFEVEKLQAFLLRKGYMPPVASLGFYGDITARAVLAFQIANIANLSWYERYILKGRLCGTKTLKALNAT